MWSSADLDEEWEERTSCSADAAADLRGPAAQRAGPYAQCLVACVAASAMS